jgi:hypothetical protein
MAGSSVCAFSNRFRKLDLGSELPVGECISGWVLPLLRLQPERGWLRESRQLLLQWPHLPYLHGRDESKLLRTATDKHWRRLLFLPGEYLSRAERPNGVYTLSDSPSYQHGQHALKFGGELLVIRVTNKRRTATNGLFPFSTLQRFFAGNMNTATIAAGDLLRHYQYESYGFFAQDDWRLKPRLTLNMGSAILLLE